MSPSYRGTRPTAVDAKWPKKSPFSPLHTPRIWPSCAADGAIRTALALSLRGARVALKILLDGLAHGGRHGRLLGLADLLRLATQAAKLAEELRADRDVDADSGGLGRPRRVVQGPQDAFSPYLNHQDEL